MPTLACAASGPGVDWGQLVFSSVLRSRLSLLLARVPTLVIALSAAVPVSCLEKQRVLKTGFDIQLGASLGHGFKRLCVDRSLKCLFSFSFQDVVWGLNSLFTDLLNFDDPLNIEAAEHHLRDKEDFRNKVDDYIKRYAR